MSYKVYNTMINGVMCPHKIIASTHAEALTIFHELTGDEKTCKCVRDSGKRPRTQKTEPCSDCPVTLYP